MKILGLLLLASSSITTLVSAQQCSQTVLCPMADFPCCSQWGWCGNTADYCAPANKCQSGCWPNNAGPSKSTTTTTVPSVTKTSAPTNAPTTKTMSRTTTTVAPAKTTTTAKTTAASTTTTTTKTTSTPVPTAPVFYIPDSTNQVENPWYDSRGVFASCPKKHTIALTFDDGPSEYTEELLDVLKKYNIKATFFVIGSNVKSSGYASSVKRAYSEGHLIGSHTWDHSDLTTLSKSQITKQMKDTEEIIFNTIGARPKYMRPPYGEYDENALSVLFGRGYKAIMWNIDTNDWQKYETNPAGIYQSIADAFGAVSDHEHKSWIPLMHDTYLQSVESVEAAIQLGIKLGYSFVRVNECFDDYLPYY